MLTHHLVDMFGFGNFIAWLLSINKPPISAVSMLVACVFCRSVARYYHIAVVSFKDVRDDSNRRAANAPYWSSCTRFFQRFREMG
jgi:hypothetical protein